MEDETKGALKQAILKSLPVVSELAKRCHEPHVMWRKSGDGHWQSYYEDKPRFTKIFRLARDHLTQAATSFSALLLAKHPEYDGMVGLAGFGSHRICANKANILRSALGCLWNRHGTFNCDEAWVDAVVDEFAEFVERASVRLSFQTQLLNYRMDAVAINLPENLTIRRLCAHEVSLLHGGPPGTLGFVRPQISGIHEFAIEGEVQAEKVFGNASASEPCARDVVKARLDKMILCLRSFKAGHVGYDYVLFRPKNFCPVPLYSSGFGDLYVPFGTYAISEEESGPLCEYTKLLFGISEPTMELACRRLADAETRTKPQDALVDAVIGMESLLLAGLAKDDRKGERRYRFSLHYSSLFDSAEKRYHAFRVAKDLYDLRSEVAHGGTMERPTYRVGTEKLKLPDATTRAKEALRWLIRRFLPHAKAAPYKRTDFWEHAYFGISDTTTQ